MASSPPRTVPIPHNLLDDSVGVGTPLPSAQPIGVTQPGLRPDNPRRVSFSRPAFQRPSQGVPITRTFTGGTRGTRDEEAFLSPVSERPPIPSALAAGGAQGAYATPLPVLPLVVLSIVSHTPPTSCPCIQLVRSDHAWRILVGECVYTIFAFYGRRFVRYVVVMSSDSKRWLQDF